MTDRLGSTDDQSTRGGRLPVALTRGCKRRVCSPVWLTRAVSVCLCVSAVGFLLTFGLVFESGGELTLITMPRSMRLVLALPYVVLVATIATGVGTGLAWWNRYWSLGVRVHQTILAVLGLGFTWQLYVLGFLG